MKPSIAPLLKERNKKRIRLLKTISPEVFANDIRGPYLSMWYTLKAQNTVLKQFRERALEYMDRCHQLKVFIDHLDALLDCPMVDLYEKAYDQICELRDILASSEITTALTSVLEICFKALLTITRGIYSISWAEGISAPPLPQESPKGIPQPDFKHLESRKDVAVCRICDTPVKLSHFEAHTQICVDTYRNQNRIDSINQDLQKFVEEIRAKLGDAKWSNINMASVMTYLPLLNACLLADRVMHLSSTNPNASVECSEVMETLDVIVKIIEDVKLSMMIVDLKERVNQKRHTAMAVMNALNIMKQGIIGDRIANKPLSISEFRFLKIISAGAYARVFLAEKEATTDVFAVKVLPRDEVRQKNQMERVMLEKDLLLQLNNKYIIKFFYAITGKNNLYLVMEYLPGGDLYSLLNKVGLLPENCARVYMFQIAMALSYLHSLGVIHRDLKPDNVLITESGFLKLVDFGLSYKGFMHRQKTIDDSTNVCQAKSVVGTPDYISPEIVMRRPHTFTVDWWALGIMLYECITSTAPFHADTELEIYSNIVKGIYAKPTNVSPECIDIISRLLDPNPETRLGAGGSDEVLKHPWFAGLDENNLQPPWIPEVTKHDVSFFDCRHQFKCGDADVLEDIKLAKSDQIMVASHIRSRSSSSVAGLRSPERLPKADNDDMREFRAVSLQPLIDANKSVLERARPRVQRDVGMPVSLSLDKLSNIAKRHSPSIPLERRRKSILSFGAQDDSVLSDMSCLSTGSGA